MLAAYQGQPVELSTSNERNHTSDCNILFSILPIIVKDVTGFLEAYKLIFDKPFSLFIITLVLCQNIFQKSVSQ